ncbi:hypothetical protein CF326_g6248 [Tilletia indica]|nr:hypothetical protein CF326_g6248 [Tilletia indica]
MLTSSTDPELKARANATVLTVGDKVQLVTREATRHAQDVLLASLQHHLKHNPAPSGAMDEDLLDPDSEAEDDNTVQTNCKADVLDSFAAEAESVTFQVEEEEELVQNVLGEEDKGHEGTKTDAVLLRLLAEASMPLSTRRPQLFKRLNSYESTSGWDDKNIVQVLKVSSESLGVSPLRDLSHGSIDGSPIIQSIKNLFPDHVDLDQDESHQNQMYLRAEAVDRQGLMRELEQVLNEARSLQSSSATRLAQRWAEVLLDKFKVLESDFVILLYWGESGTGNGYLRRKTDMMVAAQRPDLLHGGGVLQAYRASIAKRAFSPKTNELRVQQRLQCETTAMLLFSGRLCGLNLSMGTHFVPLLTQPSLYGVAAHMLQSVMLVGDDKPLPNQRKYFSADFVKNCAQIVGAKMSAKWDNMFAGMESNLGSLGKELDAPDRIRQRYEYLKQEQRKEWAAVMPRIDG